MPEWLYDAGPNGHWVFLLCTVVLGAGGAFITGKAIAETWRPFWHAIMYALLLTFFVRFMHFALFEEVLVSAKNYALDAAILMVAAGLLVGTIGLDPINGGERFTFGWLTLQNGVGLVPVAMGLFVVLAGYVGWSGWHLVVLLWQRFATA